mmetsp:Transcript_69707/g.110092  ORF Transcript_69707/g.110092 Transcript_69707/m.110092 type:complete len:205 (+) Transcript_69707:456-1070(+)
MAEVAIPSALAALLGTGLCWHFKQKGAWLAVAIRMACRAHRWKLSSLLRQIALWWCSGRRWRAGLWRGRRRISGRSGRWTYLRRISGGEARGRGLIGHLRKISRGEARGWRGLIGHLEVGGLQLRRRHHRGSHAGDLERCQGRQRHGGHRGDPSYWRREGHLSRWKRSCGKGMMHPVSWLPWTNHWHLLQPHGRQSLGLPEVGM